VIVGSVSELRRHPVKSMLGELIDKCTIGTDGIVGDRAFAVIDKRDGKIASAKNPRKWGRLLQLQARFVDEVNDGALPPVEIQFPDGGSVRSDGRNPADALSRFVGREVALARTTETSISTFEEVWPTDIPGLAPADFIAATKVATTSEGEDVSDIDAGLMAPPGSFFDVAPLHLLTSSTLRALHDQSPEADFAVSRYRPNLLIDSVRDGFVENDWPQRTLTVGDTCTVDIALATMRCVMTTLAHGPLLPDRDTLRAIARRNQIEIPGLGTWACAGVYASVAAAGVVAVGDRVALVELS
jgi:uncharacterized protein YcbX